jgi:hypothetical protein
VEEEEEEGRSGRRRRRRGQSGRRKMLRRMVMLTRRGCTRILPTMKPSSGEGSCRSSLRSGTPTLKLPGVLQIWQRGVAALADRPRLPWMMLTSKSSRYMFFDSHNILLLSFYILMLNFFIY